jgi:hypothetical protein
MMIMLNENNQLIKAFRYARERIEQEPGQEVMLHSLGCNTRDGVQYNLPSGGEIAAVIIGNYSNSEYTYDVLVHDRKSSLKCVSFLRPRSMALQYPLLFAYAEHGFHLGIRYVEDRDDVQGRRYVTMLEFVRCHVHYRLNVLNPYTCYGWLSDQIDADAYSTIEGSRLQFRANDQKELRCESVQGISDAIDKRMTSADSIGSSVIVPPSFTAVEGMM